MFRLTSLKLSPLGPWPGLRGDGRTVRSLETHERSFFGHGWRGGSSHRPWSLPGSQKGQRSLEESKRESEDRDQQSHQHTGVPGHGNGDVVTNSRKRTT